MINKWFNVNKEKASKNSKSGRIVDASGQFGQFERLEDKRMLAFSLAGWDGVTLTLQQTADDGDVVISNPTLGGTWQVQDNATSDLYVPAQNLVINMLDYTQALEVRVDSAHSGFLEVNLGDGARLTTFTGALNEIGGDLRINGGLEGQEILLVEDPGAPMIVNGDADIHLGRGLDVVGSNDQLVTVLGDLHMSGINRFEYNLQVGDPLLPPAATPLPADWFIDNRLEDLPAFILPAAGSASQIFYDFEYLGGVDIDRVDLGGSLVARNVDVDLGLGTPFWGEGQLFEMSGSVGSNGVGNMTLAASDTPTFGNEINLLGSFDGNIVTYVGGNTTDVVDYSLASGDPATADVFFTMGLGADTFLLNNSPNQLFLDFANDDGDTFENNVGFVEFNYDITNFQYFDFYFTHLNSRLVANQLQNNGDLVIDNDGGVVTGIDWRFDPAAAGVASLTPARDLVVNMLSDTLNDIEMDLENPVLAGIELNLGDGDRLVEFTGRVNTPLRNIKITADAGEQLVELAQNAPLAVATLDINLGTGYDEVIDGSNILEINEDFFLTGVNTFNHSGLLDVKRNMVVNNRVDFQENRFYTAGEFNVGGDFAYLGGDHIDWVMLRAFDGTDIAGSTQIDLGDSVVAGDQGALLMGPYMKFGSTLEVVSSNASALDLVALWQGNDYYSDISVDLGNGENTAYFRGNSNGINVSYLGGDGVDTVQYGISGVPASAEIRLGLGDDVFRLGVEASLSYLLVDFGGGNDTFINDLVVFDFDADLLSLNGFDHFYRVATSSLTSVQLEDTGDVVFSNDGPFEAIRIDAGTVLMPVSNLTVTMLDGTASNLDINLVNPLSGNLTANLGDGDRTLDLSGANNQIGGNLLVQGGNGTQTVNLALNNVLSVGNDLEISLGNDFDVVSENSNNASVAGDATLLGVNDFVNTSTFSIGGALFFDVSFESVSTLLQDSSPLAVGGDFTYLGNELDDTILFSSSTIIAGNILIDAGAGTNVMSLVNVNGGTSISYTGGSGVDSVIFGGTGSAPVLDISTGEGADDVTLAAGSVFSGPLMVNMGLGADTFTNDFGAFSFNAEILGAEGFDHIYEAIGSRLVSTQVEVFDSTEVIFSNASSLRFESTGSAVASKLMPIEDFEINLINDSMTDLSIGLFGSTVLTGDLVANLGDGTRSMSVVVDTNPVEVGAILVVSGSESQTLTINAGALLTVDGDFDVDLGQDSDQVSVTGSGLAIGGDLQLTGVNTFNPTAAIDIGQDLRIDNSSDNVESTVAIVGPITAGGDFSYVGNSLADTVFLDGANVVGGNIELQMGEGDNFASITGGVLGGTTVNFVSAGGQDVFRYAMTGSSADVTVQLGANDDVFWLDGPATINSLFVDFGTGDDTFNNTYGPLDFLTTFLSLDGFNHTYDPVAGSLVSQQVSGVGGLAKFDDGGLNEAIQVSTAGGVAIFGPVADLQVTMQDSSGDDLEVDLDFALSGNLVVDLGSGNRILQLTGDSNRIEGDLVVEAGEFGQDFDTSVNNELSVLGNASIDLGVGFDTLMVSANGATFANPLSLLNVNDIRNDGLFSVSGDLTIDVSGESQATQVIDSAVLNVAGDLDYLGSDAADTLILNDNTSIQGLIDIQAGDGSNRADILGEILGASVKYTGGSDVDVVTLGNNGTPVTVNAKLKSGDDAFTLQAGAEIAEDFLRVDFGGGDDVFNSDFGAFDFNAKLLNLDGFDAFFDLASNNIDLFQVSDSGDLMVDNNGVDSSIRFGNGGTLNEITPITDLRVVLMDNTSTDVVADFDNVREGRTVFQLKSGDRELDLTGDSNTYQDTLRVEAGTGNQTVRASVNADLNVAGTFIFNGRDGADELAADQAIDVDGKMILRGVNQFVNNSGLNVGDNFNFVTLFEDQDTNLISNAEFEVAGNLTYLGGGGIDAINFKTTGATIGGYTYVDLGEAIAATANQRAIFTGGFSTANLVVEASTAAAGNVFTTDVDTFVANEVVVNFSSSSPSNTASFFGTYGGSYATYRGGTGMDFVTLGATAGLAEFVAIMGDGDDTFVIMPPADVAFLYLDFGPGNNTLDNQYGDDLPFEANIF